MNLLPGVVVDIAPADWRISDGQRLRLLVTRAKLADSYYDDGAWVRVEGWDLDSGLAATVHVRLRD